MSARTALPSGQVTFLFTDIEGSTRLAQILGGAYRAMLAEHRRILRGTCTDHGGVPLFMEGDSVFVVFADAAAAVTACVESQRALSGHDWGPVGARPRVRMGLHTGDVRPSGGEYASAEVHRAHRVAEAAHGGQVLCSAATTRAAGRLPDGLAVVDLGAHRLRGFDQPERLHQVVAPGLDREFPRPRARLCAPDNLPRPLTRLVGRAEEQDELGRHLEGHRLVTVTGPPGVGKTRLAVQAAAERVNEFVDGVWLVDLAAAGPDGSTGAGTGRAGSGGATGRGGAGDGATARGGAGDGTAGRDGSAGGSADRVGTGGGGAAGRTPPDGTARLARAVADALGIRPEPGRAVLDTLADHVATRSMLLVMDTCDARPAAAATVLRRLLDAGPGVCVLATSRQPLGLPGELVHRIAPLSLRPGPAGAPSGALALMLDLAAGACGRRSADPIERQHLAVAAARLSGLPLAMELAARRLGVLTPAQLAARLDDPLAVLDNGAVPPAGAGRHATVRAAIGFSYERLEPDAARLLRAMAVFTGPVRLPAVAVLSGTDPLEALTVLTERCLVQAEPGPDGMTYRLLHPLRAFAAAQLRAAGEEAAARRAHLGWVRASLRDVTTGPDGGPVTLSMYALDPVAPEVRTALDWSVTAGRGRDALALLVDMETWWRERGLAREARQWFARAYARLGATAERVPDAELARAYLLHAEHAGSDGEYGEETRYGALAEQAARRAGDPGLLARALSGRGGALLDMADAAAAERTCREVISWARERDVAADALFATCCLARLLWRRGALAEAADVLAAARPLESRRPAEQGRRTIDMLLGTVALARGDLVAAHDHLTVALRSRARFGFLAHACDTLHAFAVCCALGGEPVLAARLFGAAQAGRSRLRVGALLVESYWVTREKALRDHLGDAAFDAAYAEGAALDLDTAIPMALAASHPDLAAGSNRFVRTATPAP